MVTRSPAPTALTLSALLLTGLALATAPAPAVEDRSGAMLCVIAPRVEATSSDPLGRGVVMERPALVVTDPLQEVMIRGSQRPTVRLRSPGGVLPPVIPWQGEALKPGELVTLRLHPASSPPGQGASLQLVAASAEVLADYQLEKRRLGQRADAWLTAVEGHLDRGDSARAWALLFDPDAPRGKLLEALRQEVIHQGCGEPMPPDRQG